MYTIHQLEWCLFGLIKKQVAEQAAELLSQGFCNGLPHRLRKWHDYILNHELV
jgi:hypothetical protein